MMYDTEYKIISWDPSYEDTDTDLPYNIRPVIEFYANDELLRFANDHDQFFQIEITGTGNEYYTGVVWGTFDIPTSATPLCKRNCADILSKFGPRDRYRRLLTLRTVWLSYPWKNGTFRIFPYAFGNNNSLNHVPENMIFKRNQISKFAN